MAMSGRLECEGPNRHLYDFTGTLRLENQKWDTHTHTQSRLISSPGRCFKNFAEKTDIMFCCCLPQPSSSGPRPGFIAWGPAQEHAVGCGNCRLHGPRLQTDAGKSGLINCGKVLFSKCLRAKEFLSLIWYFLSRVSCPCELGRKSFKLLINCAMLFWELVQAQSCF